MSLKATWLGPLIQQGQDLTILTERWSKVILIGSFGLKKGLCLRKTVLLKIQIRCFSKNLTNNNYAPTKLKMMPIRILKMKMNMLASLL